MTKIKNKFMNRSWLLLLATGLLLILGSCNKQLDIQSSRQADEAGHWTSYEDARSGLMGLYGLFRAAVADNNAHWLLGELRSGDFKSVSRPDLKAIIDGNLNASFPAIQSVTDWRRFYAVVNACNLFIERVKECEADQRYTESYYKLDIAQARTLRAFVYFYMVRIWGDVPLITRSQDGTFEQLPRTNQDAVLSFVEQELKEAAPYLPYLYSGNDPEQKYPNNYYGNNSAYWLNMPMTRLGAYALLAHVAAWQGRYVDVAIYTDFIINNASKSNLKLLSSDEVVNGLFDASNTTLGYNQLLGFSFLKTRGETTTEGHIEQLTLANTTLYAMSKQMPDIYVPKDVISVIFPKTNGNDDRFGVDTTTFLKLPTTRYFENYSSAVPVFKKVRVVDGSAGNRGKFAVFNSSIVFTRLEEIRLLRAEALAVLGQTNDAFTELNVIRGQRKITPVSATSGADPIDEIFAERRREFMGEGWRWYDLIRYNRIKRNNAAFNELIDQGGIYWPIAHDVLNRNPKLVQNAYWQ